MSKIYFAHRPPSVGVHLLSDPFPPRTVSPAASQGDEADTGVSKRQTRPAKTKKPTLRS
jgi:hypothetical protein